MENTVPNIRRSALEYFVDTARDGRKLLGFAWKHHAPSQNSVWAQGRTVRGAQRPENPCPSRSSHHSQTSKHKKTKDSKNSSSAAHVDSKTAEEKKKWPLESLEKTQAHHRAVGPAAGRGNREKDGDAEPAHTHGKHRKLSRREKTSASPAENDDAGEKS